MKDLLIEKGMIVTESTIFTGSVSVSDGKIDGIYREDAQLPKAEKIIDARGLMVFPGFIDTHIHLNEPGQTWREDIEHGTKAAAMGGITTLIDMPNTCNPPTYNCAAVAQKMKLINESAAIDVALWGALVNYNLENLKDLHDMGVCGYKCFVCDPGPGEYTSLTDEEMIHAMNIIRDFDGVAGFHCEDDSLITEITNRKRRAGTDTRQDYLETRCVEVELVAAKRVIENAKKTGCPTYICHTSHPMVAKEIGKARREGYPIYGETCPHYLLFTENDYLEKGGVFKCCPPLRSNEARSEMVECLLNDCLHTLGSDHCPVPAEDKDEKKYGCIDLHNGMAGNQSMVQATYDYLIRRKGLNPCFLTKIFSTNAARIFGLYGQKGDIKIGFDGDFTIIDPEKTWFVTQNELEYVNKYSAYDSMSGVGCPVITIVRGNIVAENGEIKGKYGKFVKAYAEGKTYRF